jgi:hypothetical protein
VVARGRAVCRANHDAEGPAPKVQLNSCLSTGDRADRGQQMIAVHNEASLIHANFTHEEYAIVLILPYRRHVQPSHPARGTIDTQHI